VLVGLASSGLHTNGYSLARRIVAERLRLAPHDPFPDAGASVADVLLAVHRIEDRRERGEIRAVHAMAHITGGGVPGNLDRALPGELDAVVDTATWAVPSVFRVLGEAGDVPRDEMWRAFNMGVGMIVITDAAGVRTVMQSTAAQGIPAWEMGTVIPGSGSVRMSGVTT